MPFIKEIYDLDCLRDRKLLRQHIYWHICVMSGIIEYRASPCFEPDGRDSTHRSLTPAGSTTAAHQRRHHLRQCFEGLQIAAVAILTQQGQRLIIEIGRADRGQTLRYANFSVSDHLTFPLRSTRFQAFQPLLSGSLALE